MDDSNTGYIPDVSSQITGNVPLIGRAVVRVKYRMSAEMVGRVLQRAKELGLSPRAASLKAGMGDSAIRDMVRKPNLSPSLETVRKLAEALETTPEWLAYGNGGEPAVITGEAQQIQTRLVPASYAGVVEAGSWREVEEFADFDHLRAPRAEPADREYPHAKLFYFDVAGDSMNALKPVPILPGQQVVCLEYASLANRVPWRDGMVVVVEQLQKGGLMRERSVKQIEVYRDRTEFHPRSSNPKHKPIVVPFEGDMEDGRTVEILGIVRRITSEVEI